MEKRYSKIKYVFFPLILLATIAAFFLMGAPTSHAANLCTPSIMIDAGFSSSDVDDAIAICLAESSGDAGKINSSCFSGIGPDYSVGLFQMNLYINFSAGGNRCVDWADTADPWGTFHDESPTLCVIDDTTALNACAIFFGSTDRNDDEKQALENAIKAHTLWAGAGGDDNAWCIHWKNTATTLGFCGDFDEPELSGTGPIAPIDAVELGPIRLNVDFPPIPIPGGTFDLNEIIEKGEISIGQLIIFIFAVSLWLGGIVAFISLVYAGFLYILSGESPGNRAKAKKRMQDVVWGIGILLSAVLILNFIDPRLTNLSLTTPSLSICAPYQTTNCIPRFDGIQTTGCNDTDGDVADSSVSFEDLNIAEAGTCRDAIKVDYIDTCTGDTSIILVEYFCNTTNGQCEARGTVCPANTTCSNTESGGFCKPLTVTCTDTDTPANNPNEAGTCTQAGFAPQQDECATAEILVEYSCTGIVGTCRAKSISCVAVGTTCVTTAAGGECQ